jgi:D-serine deaminase-like pyridoxal phosphate-dependent protein
MNAQQWYTINDLEKLDTPALVIYPGRVNENIKIALQIMGDASRLRPHVKTHKCRETTMLMLSAGISKFKCATIAEAEMLGLCKAPDVLLAYQPVGPKPQRLVKLVQSYRDTRYSCLIDNIVAAKCISAVALDEGLTIPVYIDLNVGQNRTGVLPGDALGLYVECQALPGINIIGLHAYDGHLHDADMALRTFKCHQAFEPVAELQQQIIGKGYPEPVIIAGGSPTFPIHARRDNVECSPGTFIYWDRGYSLTCAEQPFLTAAIVVSRVISLPDATKICLDVGHKSVSAENEIGKRIYFLNAPELQMTGQSEEHLVCEAPLGHHYKVGDVLYGLPYHICPTVALYERAITVDESKINGAWRNIARDRKINF